MKENINNLSRLSNLKRTLEENHVSAIAINSIEKALKKGLNFRNAADLGILNLPAADISILESTVTFGATPSATVSTFQFTFKASENKNYFYGYQFILTYVNKDQFTIAETFPIEDTGMVYIDLDMADIADGSKVHYEVKTPGGETALIGLGNTADPKEELIEVNKTAIASATIRVKVLSVATESNPDIFSSYRIKGKLISTNADKTDGYQVIIMAATSLATDGTPDFYPVAYATTETNGYFITGFLVFNSPEDIDRVLAAKSVISKDDKTWERSIRLLKTEEAGIDTTVITRIPGRLIIVISEDMEGSEENGDSKDGCYDLNFHEKKVLEEYSYYTVVRTTEPSIIADTIEDEEEVDLDNIYGTGGRVSLTVFRKYQAAVNTIVKPINHGALMSTATTDRAMMARSIVNPALSSTFNKDLLDKLVIDGRVSTVLKGKNKRQFKGRTYLNPLNQLDWDDEPTIYQAASVAHGHLLHFKQEWMPDGYSIGDIIYSLPLAPGQKKQIAVLDWERRESAANSQQIDYEETLNNTLVHDRDINEVVNATLNENIKANSKAGTGGIGFGTGSAIMGIFNGGSYGGLMGISGGKSSAWSNAGQNAHRDSTASSIQSISDRTTQAASMVRSQRSTVIQTVSQGERVQATAESVANYNHCHAMTIQYFEVLRHFKIQTRLADVQECLFVPLQITSFNLEKCKRWRTTLEKFLFKRKLLNGFDAINRLLHEKENGDNYYDSIGFPRVNFAEQSMKVFTGELYFEFSFFNTKDGVLDDATFQFFRDLFNISLDPYKDRYISSEELSEIVGPRAIEFLLNTIVIETDKNVNLAFDLSLISRFRQSATLQISIRQSAQTPRSIPRNQVEAIKIRMDMTRLNAGELQQMQFSNKYMKIKVRSGELRYQSSNFSGKLFGGRIENDLFADEDGVYIATPPTADELRNPRGEDIDAANNLIHHLNENMEYYHKCIWFDMTPERRYMLLDGIIAPGKAKGRSVASVVENKLIGIAGNSLILPVAPGNQLDPTIDETFNLFAQYYSEGNDPVRLSMPTKGVYAEAVMGKCNSCEVKDESRFWRWEESPIPDSPNTQILPVNMDTRRADPGNLQPKDFPNPVVNIQNAPALPDPSGLQSILQLIGKGDSFRDLTGLNQNQLNALATFQKSLDTAMAFGKEASELAKAAVSLKMVEDGKKSGTINNEDANKRSNEILDNLQKDPNASRLQQSIDLIDKLKKEGKISDADAEAVKNSLLKNFQDSSNAKNTMANDEIRKLAEKAKETNKDISIKRPDGETVEIKNPGDNSSSSPESGLQGLSLDAIAAGGTLKFLPVNGTEPVDPSKAQLKIILDNGGWVPTTMRDYSSLITGDNTLGFRAFTGLLRHLSILPKGSVQILNLICHCPDFQTLVFRRDFIFSELTGETKAVDPDPQSPAFNEVTSLELMQLSTMETLAVSGELQMKLEDVRTTFAADAEVRLFCIGDKATESLAQTLSNLFQVKVLSFTDARIEFRVEIIEGAEVFNQPALTKKIVATPQFSTVPFVFDNFEQMVTEDAAKTGRFISHPRRP